jgi:RNA polymerase sigma-70 factor (ECF subfamily)
MEQPALRVEVETAVRGYCAAGDWDAATTAALQGYGAEVFRFLVALMKQEADASELFSVFAEKLWRSLETFAWGCSLRAWVYTIARRAAFRALRRKRRDPLLRSSSEPVSQVVDLIRSETLSYLRTERKTRILALRDALPDDDRALLMLRVDRGLAWDELVGVMHDGELEGEARKREAARLRKRFQLIKEKLKAMATEQGLYAPK